LAEKAAQRVNCEGRSTSILFYNLGPHRLDFSPKNITYATIASTFYVQLQSKKHIIMVTAEAVLCMTNLKLLG